MCLSPSPLPPPHGFDGTIARAASIASNSSGKDACGTASRIPPHGKEEARRAPYSLTHACTAHSKWRPHAPEAAAEGMPHCCRQAQAAASAASPGDRPRVLTHGARRACLRMWCMTARPGPGVVCMGGPVLTHDSRRGTRDSGTPPGAHTPPFTSELTSTTAIACYCCAHATRSRPTSPPHAVSGTPVGKRRPDHRPRVPVQTGTHIHAALPKT